MMALESETVEMLEATALQLTPAERARLVDRLIATVYADREVEEARAAEVERRQTEIENGTASLLRGPETLANSKLSLNKLLLHAEAWGKSSERCAFIAGKKTIHELKSDLYKISIAFRCERDRESQKM